MPNALRFILGVCSAAIWVCLTLPAHAIDLPPEAQRDMYTVSLANHLKAEEWRKAYPYFEKIEAINRKHKLKSDISITYYRGEVAFHTRKHVEAQKYLVAYIRKAGNQGPYYGKSLNLLSQLDSIFETDPHAIWKLAQEHKKNKDMTKAIPLYQKSAELAYPWAASELAEIYQNGDGVKKDILEAIKWYKQPFVLGKKIRGYKMGWSECAEALGKIYYQGYGDIVKKDFSKAMKWYLKGAGDDSAALIRDVGTGYPDGYSSWADKSRSILMVEHIYRMGGPNFKQDLTLANQWVKLIYRLGKTPIK